MITKKQTSATADALMHGSRHQREMRDYRLLWYPELENISFRDRSSALREARGRAWRTWPVISALIVVVAVFVGWVVTRKLGLSGNSEFGAAHTLAVVFAATVFRWRMRSELRWSMWRQ